MNNYNTQSILKYFLLVTIVLVSGCGQSTIIDSPSVPSQKPTETITLEPTSTLTSTVSVPAATSTSLPCFSLPEKPTTLTATIAEDWFLSEIPQVTSRDQYRFIDSLEAWVGVCKIYQHSIQSGENWTKSPTEIALRIVTQNSYLDLYTPNKILLVAENDEILATKNNHLIPPVAYRNIAIVVIEYSHFDFHAENRFDFIRENGIWQFRWWGTRWQCIGDTDATIWHTGTRNCP